MKLYDLINSNHWLSVEMTLLELYPDQEEMLDEYRGVFEHLKNIAPEDDAMKIVLEERGGDPDGEVDIDTYVEVSGQDGTKDDRGRTIGYAIEFTEWKKWLGVDIESNTLERFSALEIIAHCLYEMTFVGYDEEVIREERRALEESIDAFKNLSEEERKRQSVSLDDLLKRLDGDGQDR